MNQDRSEVDEDEQRPADGTSDEGDAPPADMGERPEADVLEQAELVEEQQSVQRSPRPPDVSEADWLEQSVTESLDDDRR